MQTNRAETQLGVIDLISAIWSQKWVILVVFALGTLASYIFAINISNTLEISSEVDQLSEDSSIELRRLRTVGLLPYTERDMLLRFARYIQDTDIVDRASQDSKISNLNLDDEERDMFINGVVRSIEMKPKVRRLGDDAHLYYVLSYSASNIDKTVLESFVNNLLNFANDQLVSDLLGEVASRIEDKENAVSWEIVSLNEEIESLNRLHIADINDSKSKIIIEIDKLKEEHYLLLEDEITRVQNDMKNLRIRDSMELEDTIGNQSLVIDRERSEYELKKKDRIVFLREQLEIAEALGIELPSDMGQIVPQNAAVASIHSSDPPYYYKGTIAINKEMDEISGRIDNDSFVPKLRDLESDLAYLEKKRNDDRFVEGIRKLESDLLLLQQKRNNDSYVPGLRDLQVKSDLLDIQRKNPAFVEGVNSIQQEIISLENDIELALIKKVLSNVLAERNGIRFTSYDERKSTVNNVSGRQKRLTVILGTGASAISALLIGLLIWSIKKSYLREF